MQSDNLPSVVSNANQVYLTCRNPEHLTNTCKRDSWKNHKLDQKQYIHTSYQEQQI